MTNTVRVAITSMATKGSVLAFSVPTEVVAPWPDTWAIFPSAPANVVLWHPARAAVTEIDSAPVALEACTPDRLAVALVVAEGVPTAVVLCAPTIALLMDGDTVPADEVVWLALRAAE